MRSRGAPLVALLLTALSLTRGDPRPPGAPQPCGLEAPSRRAAPPHHPYGLYPGRAAQGGLGSAAPSDSRRQRGRRPRAAGGGGEEPRGEAEGRLRGRAARVPSPPRGRPLPALYFAGGRETLAARPEALPHIPRERFTLELWVKAEGGQSNPAVIAGKARRGCGGRDALRGREERGGRGDRAEIRSCSPAAGDGTRPVPPTPQIPLSPRPGHSPGEGLCFPAPRPPEFGARSSRRIPPGPRSPGSGGRTVAAAPRAPPRPGLRGAPALCIPSGSLLRVVAEGGFSPWGETWHGGLTHGLPRSQGLVMESCNKDLRIVE